jgi:hypothetical protein
MENLELEIKKHERAIKILEAYKESDRRYNDHLGRLERNEKLFGWEVKSWNKQRMIANFNIGLRLARMYENL